MKERDLRYIGISASWISICVIGLSMLHLASKVSGFEIIFFIFWGVSPYGVLILGEWTIRKIAVNPKITKFFSIISILLLIFTIYACIAVIGSQSSTAGLVFVFLPLYLNVLAVFLVVSGIIWVALSTTSKK